MEKPTYARVGVFVQNQRGEFLTVGTLVWRKPRRTLRVMLGKGTIIERCVALHFLHDVSIVEELKGMPDITKGVRWRVWRVTVARKPSGWKK